MVDLHLTPRLEALSRLAEIAGATFTLRDEEILRWTKGEKPTEEEIQSKISSISYARNRATEYPSIQEQLDLQYWDKVNSTSKWDEAVKAVKDKYPKPK